MSVFVACIVICIISIIALLYCYYHRSSPRESFESASTSVAFATNVLQTAFWTRPKSIESRSLAWDNASWGKFVSNMNVATLTKAKNAYVILDPLDQERHLKEKRVVASLPVGYFCAIFRLGTAICAECSFDFVGKRVGYLDRSDYLFIQSIIHGYRMAPPAELYQIPIQRWDMLEEELQRLDIIIAYIIPKSDLHRLLKTQTLSLRGFKNLDADRIRLFHPFIEMKPANLKNIFRDTPGTSLQVMEDEADTILPSMRLQLVRLRGTQRVVEGFGNFILQFDEDAYDPSYKCYGDLSIEQKYLCESPYDVIGMKKRRPTVWDRPCIRNEDCPFYKGNKNYSNNRGGCLKGGVCEMPVGIRRTAYRKYDRDGNYAPFCYGCENPKDPKCCDKQSYPDYAFPNDRAARIRAGMKETIMRMK